MGPPPFGSGNLPCRFQCVARWTLQWGHRLSAVETSASAFAPSWSSRCFNGATAFRQWKPDGPMCHPLDHGASMGPPPFGSGNFQNFDCDKLAIRRFNGATAFRQWKPLMISGVWFCTECFNGATAFRQWKHILSLAVNADTLGASMGPPPFGSGNMYSGCW